jgi:hypothetical protein
VTKGDEPDSGGLLEPIKRFEEKEDMFRAFRIDKTGRLTNVDAIVCSAVLKSVVEIDKIANREMNRLISLAALLHPIYTSEAHLRTWSSERLCGSDDQVATKVAPMIS